MKQFSAGAMHRAIDGARLASANDLVRRTLAQHGLSTEGTGAASALPTIPQMTMPQMPTMAGLTAALSPQVRPAAEAATLTPGASFDSDRFTCDAGSRDYLTYVPASAKDGAKGLVMMLHGCTQNGADFATGTGMNALAETHGLIVVYPQQSRGDNAQSCWNWFSPGDQRQGRGEPAILAGIALHVAQIHDVTPQKTFVAGLSAGAAMAVILGQTYGDVFAAVGAHSGLPLGAAKDVASAFAAMSNRSADASPQAKPGHVTRTIVFHGTADHTVNPANGERIAVQLLQSGPDQTMLRSVNGQQNGRSFKRDITTTTEGAALLEHWTIEGLGHAWSGGQPSGSYTDAAGPDASAEMVRFFLQKVE